MFVALLGLLATAAAVLVVGRIERQRQAERFGAHADVVTGAIQDQLQEHRLLLRGVAAFFNASEEVDRGEFADYIERLRIPQFHAGTLGVGFAMEVSSPEEWRAAMQRVRTDGTADPEAWPQPSSYPASIIMLLEPEDRTNRGALGFNMYGEGIRRAAMKRAMSTGAASMSGLVRLVQDPSRAANPGFLIYQPVGQVTGARPGTTSYGRGGWVYSPLRALDFVRVALERRNLREARVEVFDGAPGKGSLLYRSADFGEPELVGERQIDFGGRSWTVRVGSSPAFLEDEPLSLAWAVGVGGGLLTLLLVLLAAQQSRLAARTEAEVARATAELRRINAELVAASRARDAAEEQLRQSQKLEAVGQLTGGIAHDFNNMLAVIIGNLDMAVRRTGDPERLARALAHAREGARRAAELTQRLLAFGRRQPLAPRLLDPDRLVSEMSELLARTLGEQIRLRIELADNSWLVEADPGQLENALLNLAINARDAMPAGGALTISTHQDQIAPDDDGAGSGLAPGDWVRIAVADTGAGMTPEVLARAFDPFFTTKEVGKGTGLGLSMVFGFVRQSGGHIRIDSQPDQGTTVHLCLPRASGDLVASDPLPHAGALQRGRADEVIVVAEDQEDVRLTTVECLRELGYTVVHAGSGAEALDALARHGGATLLLTDVVMPGMNGRELAERAQALHPELKVVFTTGYTADAIVDDGRLHPGIRLLPKPFTTSQLATCLRSALDEADRGERR